jgi:hypothetical protein
LDGVHECCIPTKFVANTAPPKQLPITSLPPPAPTGGGSDAVLVLILLLLVAGTGAGFYFFHGLESNKEAAKKHLHRLGLKLNTDGESAAAGQEMSAVSNGVGGVSVAVSDVDGGRAEVLAVMPFGVSADDDGDDDGDDDKMKADSIMHESSAAV